MLFQEIIYWQLSASTTHGNVRPNKRRCYGEDCYFTLALSLDHSALSSHREGHGEMTNMPNPHSIITA